MCDKEEHSGSKFYYPEVLQFQENSDLTATNYERVGDRDNETKSQEEIETFVKEHSKWNSQWYENMPTVFVI